MTGRYIFPEVFRRPNRTADKLNQERPLYPSDFFETPRVPLVSAGSRFQAANACRCVAPVCSLQSDSALSRFVARVTLDFIHLSKSASLGSAGRNCFANFQNSATEITTMPAAATK